MEPTNADGQRKQVQIGRRNLALKLAAIHGLMNSEQLRESPRCAPLDELTIGNLGVRCDRTEKSMDMLLSKTRGADRKKRLQAMGDPASLEVRKSDRQTREELMKNLRFIAACAAFAVCAPLASAQAPSPEDFAKRDQVSAIALSPNGDKVALAVASLDGMETQVLVVPLDEKGKMQPLRFFGRQNHVANLVWTDVNRLVVSKAAMEPLQPRPYSTGELYAADIDGSNHIILFGKERRNDNGFARVSHVIREQPGAAFVSFRSYESGTEPDTLLYRVDTHSGERHLVEKFPGNAGFLADHKGVVRVEVTQDQNDEPLLRYRPKPDSDWRPVPAAIAGYNLSPLRIAEDDNTLYALVSDHKEPEQLYQIDLAAGTRTRLAGRDDMDVAHVLFQGHSGAPFGVIYDSGKPAIDYFDKTSEWTKLHAGLMQYFAGELVSFLDVSNDDRKVLFSVYSDRHPGAYYVLDRFADKSVTLIREYRAWIKPERMASTRSIEFRARDGLKLYGFYTANGTTPRPLIVMPHGGPYGPYDTWGFDEETQFLATRGYGVLQINFRGSGGRGEAFIESGYREWGGKIQDDIADGVHWALDNKLAPADKVCIFGASFGGYSALMNPIRYPDLYKCAVGYDGVYDLSLMFERGDVRDSKSGRRYLERVLGTDPAVLAANSPAKQAVRLKLPILLVQGGADRRAPGEHFDAMVRAMRANNEPVETLVGKGEGHGFYKPENIVRLYNALSAFLDKSLGTQVK